MFWVFFLSVRRGRAEQRRGDLFDAETVVTAHTHTHTHTHTHKEREGDSDAYTNARAASFGEVAPGDGISNEWWWWWWWSCAPYLSCVFIFWRGHARRDWKPRERQISFNELRSWSRSFFWEGRKERKEEEEKGGQTWRNLPSARLLNSPHTFLIFYNGEMKSSKSSPPPPPLPSLIQARCPYV